MIDNDSGLMDSIGGELEDYRALENSFREIPNTCLVDREVLRAILYGEDPVFMAKLAGGVLLANSRRFRSINKALESLRTLVPIKAVADQLFRMSIDAGQKWQPKHKKSDPYVYRPYRDHSYQPRHLQT